MGPECDRPIQLRWCRREEGDAWGVEWSQWNGPAAGSCFVQQIERGLSLAHRRTGRKRAEQDVINVKSFLRCTLSTSDHF